MKQKKINPIEYIEVSDNTSTIHSLIQVEHFRLE